MDIDNSTPTRRHIITKWEGDDHTKPPLEVIEIVDNKVVKRTTNEASTKLKQKILLKKYLGDDQTTTPIEEIEIEDGVLIYHIKRI